MDLKKNDLFTSVRDDGLVVDVVEQESRAGNWEPLVPRRGPDERPREGRLAGSDVAVEQEGVSGLPLGGEQGCEQRGAPLARGEEGEVGGRGGMSIFIFFGTSVV